MSVSTFSLILAIGTIAFYFEEPTVKGDLGQSFWLTIVTVLTVGYGDVVPTTDLSKAIASVVMVSGIGAGIYTLTMIFQLVVTNDLRKELGIPQRRTRMKDHYIVCGYGMVGRQVVSELQCKNEPFIVIEIDSPKVQMMVEKGIPVLQGDSEDEETLKKANISEAKGLITTMKDSQNLVAIIAAKTLNPNLHIVSEVEEVKNVPKYKRVGAVITINCHEMGAKTMVNMARHAVTDPVCGAEASSIRNPFSFEYEGKNLVFCSKECLEAFKLHPERFRSNAQGGVCSTEK